MPAPTGPDIEGQAERRSAGNAPQARSAAQVRASRPSSYVSNAYSDGPTAASGFALTSEDRPEAPRLAEGQSPAPVLARQDFELQ